MDDHAEMQRLREESQKLEQAQREIEAERAQLRAELKAKRAKKKAEEAKKAEELKKETKEKDEENKREIRRQPDLELRKEDEARVAHLPKGNPVLAKFSTQKIQKRAKLWFRSGIRIADYQKEQKKIAQEEKAKEDRRPEVERILRESGGLALKAEEIRAQLTAMKEKGAWKQFHQKRQVLAQVRDWSGIVPSQRKSTCSFWNLWNRPWGQVSRDCYAKGYYSCGSQGCKGKHFQSNTVLWQRLSAKQNVRGHPG